MHRLLAAINYAPLFLPAAIALSFWYRWATEFSVTFDWT